MQQKGAVGSSETENLGTLKRGRDRQHATRRSDASGTAQSVPSARRLVCEGARIPDSDASAIGTMAFIRLPPMLLVAVPATRTRRARL